MTGCSADRHGTHGARRNHGCNCPEAIAARRRHDKQYALRRARGERGCVLAAPYSLRLRALVADGWKAEHMATLLGVSPSEVRRWWRGDRSQLHLKNAERITRVYQRLAGTPGPSTRARAYGRRQGWLTPDDLDLPAPPPDVLDEVNVERARRGEQVTLTRAERDETARRLYAAGETPTSIARRFRLSGATANRILGVT